MVPGFSGVDLPRCPSHVVSTIGDPLDKFRVLDLSSYVHF
jgi:hypothetical protein